MAVFAITSNRSVLPAIFQGCVPKCVPSLHPWHSSGVHLCFAFSAVYAASISAECNTCITSGPCDGVRAWGNNGAPIGCNGSCEGTCQKCKNGTSSSFCQFTGDDDDTCISDTGAWINCGDTYELDCSGGSYPACSCTGDETYVDSDCKLHFCS